MKIFLILSVLIFLTVPSFCATIYARDKGSNHVTSESLHSDNACIDRGDSAAVKVRCGEIISIQKCEANPEQSYALYVPSYYTPDVRWPIVYIFEPGGRGSLPLDLMKSAAEYYGYILAASNNSHNGPLKPQADAAQAMWIDTHSWLALDDRRIYFSGCSGGARFASLFAQTCKCAQAVFLSGAGYLSTSVPSKDDTFAVFGIVGTTDFNYAEMVKLDASLEALGKRHFLRRFDGPHQWAPAELWEEAFAWAELIAMQNGTRSRNDTLVAKELTAALHRAETLDLSGFTYWAFQNYCEISKIFNGLADTKTIDERIKTLRDSDLLKKSEENEAKDLEEEKRIGSDVLRKIELMQNPNSIFTARGQVPPSIFELRSTARKAVVQLRKHAEEERPDKLPIYKRVLADVFGYLMINGNSAFEQNDQHLAQQLLELSIEACPKEVWPHVMLARSFIKSDDKDEALDAIRQARVLGLSALEISNLAKKLPELIQISGDTEFQKIITNDQPAH